MFHVNVLFTGSNKRRLDFSEGSSSKVHGKCHWQNIESAEKSNWDQTFGRTGWRERRSGNHL